MADDLFIKEVVGGKLVEIERFTIGKLLKTMAIPNVQEHEKLAYFMCSVTKVNGIPLDPKKFLESDDLQLFNFISESFNAMTNNNLL